MSYLEDPLIHTVQWLRGRTSGAPGVRDAFAAAWRDWAGEAPQDVKIFLGSINYEPFERVRIMARATVLAGDGESDGESEVKHLNLFLHAFADRQAADTEFVKGQGKSRSRCDGPPVFHLPSRRIVIWTLPNAPSLGELPGVMDSQAFRSLLPSEFTSAAEHASCEAPVLDRYIPSERALLTWEQTSESGRLYVKFIADSTEAAGAALNLRELQARGEHGEFSFSVPRLVRYSPEQQTLIMTEVPGRAFTDVVIDLRATPFREIGKALAELHGIPTTPLTRWSTKRELAGVRRHMRGVRRALPQLHERLDAVLQGLEQRAGMLPVVSPTPIHGNLFGDQILFNDNADASPVGIVDWDNWCFGDPHLDLGRLVAHALYVAERERLPKRGSDECITALIAGYELTRGSQVQGPWLEWHIATALLLQAKIHSLHKLADGWPGHFEFAVSEAERYLRKERLMPTQSGAASLVPNMA